MATGPAAVKSCEPILQPPTAPSSRPSNESASSSRSTSRAMRTRSAGRGGLTDRVILLQAPHLVLALEQRLDRPDGGLDAVDGEVVGNVLGDRGMADQIRVLAGPAVLGCVEDQPMSPGFMRSITFGR